MKNDRIRFNEDGTLDEVVLTNCTFHLEQMSDGHWFIGIYWPKGKRYDINLYTKRGAKIHARLEENT